MSTPARSASQLRNLIDARPVAVAVVLTAAWLVVSTVLVLLVSAIAPDSDMFQRAIVPLIALTVLVAALVGRLGWWREVGLNGPTEWRHVGLFGIPLVIVVAPLVGGITLPEAGTLGLLIVGYLLTGFTEETFSRGLVQRILRPLGPVRAVVVMAVLFGILHLGNLFLRDSAAIVFAQAFGAFTFAIGYGALRLRTGTIVPLMGLHFGHDLILRLTNLPAIPVDVVQDIVLLVLGIWILRGIRAEASLPVSTETAVA